MQSQLEKQNQKIIELEELMQKILAKSDNSK